MSSTSRIWHWLSDMPRVKIDPDKKHPDYKEKNGKHRGYKSTGPHDRRHQNGDRRRFEPQAWQREMAQKLAGIGLPQQHIAKLLEIDLLTLRKYMQHELDLGIAQVQSLYLNKAFELIMGGNVSMLQFYLSRKMGWVEPKTPQDAEDSQELDGMTDEQLRTEIDAIVAREGIASKARSLATTM